MTESHAHPVTFDEPWWKQRLHDVSLRATSARLDVLRVLAASPLPLTAQDVLELVRKTDESADRVTVYRTLSSLVDAGIAHRMDPGDRVWRFGLLGRGESHEHRGHAHFVCDACGEVRCLADSTISVALKGRATEQRLKIKQQDVYLHGTCETCQDDENASAPAHDDAAPKPGPRPAKPGRKN